jgi:carboxypeptidase PM20D1
MLKRALAGVGLAGLVLVAVVVGRAAMLTSQQPEVAASADPVRLDAAALASRLAGGLSFETVSNQDPAQLDAEAFRALHDYLESSFPRLHAALERERPQRYSLLYTWPGAEPKLDPVLLLAHTDVVPVEPGDAERWTYPPFAGRIADGYIWGRGALDDKVCVFGLLEAVEYLLALGVTPRRTVLLAFGHDEEQGGDQGAASMAKLLEERGIRPLYVLDEGGGIVTDVMPGVEGPVAGIAIAEKGYVSVELTVEVEGGHSSVPSSESAIGILSRAVDRLERNPMPARLAGAGRAFVESLGPELPFSYRLAVANLWLFEPALVRFLSAVPFGNALVRTTTAPTIFQAGVKANVLPSRARAVVNFRTLPGDSSQHVVDHVRRTIGDLRVGLHKLAKIREPSRESRIDSQSYTDLVRTIRLVFSEVPVVPNLALGGTDSRHYRDLSENVYRFTPVLLAAEDIKRIHGRDERISVEAYARLVAFYVQLLRNTAL